MKQSAYYMGIDGGGTKTAYLLVNESGTVLSQRTGPGTSCRQQDYLWIEEELYKQILECCKEARISEQNLTGIAFALPCYGEGDRIDQNLRSLAENIVQKIKKKANRSLVWYLCNDVEAGWAGSLGLACGIHVVAGTGSIACGQDIQGNQIRCGGWSEQFSDLGSCYWIGRKAIERFAKEADEMVPRGQIYQMLQEALSLKQDTEFTEIVEREILPSREKTAALQKYVLAAANLGDAYAIQLYREAAEELILMIDGVRRKIGENASNMELPMAISYSGGLFHADQYVLPALFDYAEKAHLQLTKPEFTPVQGAVLLAVRAVMQKREQEAQVPSADILSKQESEAATDKVWQACNKIIRKWKEANVTENR